MRWSVMQTPPPSVGIDISPRRVSAVALSVGEGRARLTGHHVEPLPEGAVVPTLNGRNVQQPEAVREAVARTLAALPRRPRNVALIVPDSVAKVSLIPFEAVPARTDDLMRLIRWQMRRSVPFPIEQAQLTTAQGRPLPGGGREFLVTVARRDIVEEYEAACRDAGAHAGIVDLATFNLINVVRMAERGDLRATGSDGATPSDDWLLVHVTLEYTSLAIGRGDAVIFFRSRSQEEAARLSDLAHQTAMYYQDRLGGERLARIVVADPDRVLADQDRGVMAELETRLGVTPRPLDLEGVVDGLHGGRAALPGLEALAAGLGVVLREHAA